jgi:ELWxxDGT repeat protein
MINVLYLKGIGIIYLLFLCNISSVHAQAFLVKDINEGITGSFNTNGQFESTTKLGINGVYYFAADDGIHGTELWRSDGTAEGTYMVKDIREGGNGSALEKFASYDSVLYFNANDGIHGKEVWRSDGTEAGTYLLKDINEGNTSGISFADFLVSTSNYLYFTGDNGVNGNELWRSDGTEEGTIVLDLLPGNFSSLVREMFVWRDTLYFTANFEDDIGTELYKTDGTIEGTTLVKNIYELDGFSSFPEYFTATNEYLYFVADTDTFGEELWRTDGSEAGTQLVADLEPGSGSPFDFDFGDRPSFVRLGSQLVFTAKMDDSQAQIWITDGSSEGTSLVYDLQSFSAPLYLTEFNEAIYFFGSEGFSNDGLWRTDGTQAGTSRIDAFSVGSSFFDQSNLLTYNGRLAIIGNRNATGHELYESNGEEDNAVLVTDINPGLAHSYPTKLVATGGKLFFTADDGTNGYELWAYISEPVALSATIEEVDPVLCPGDATAALLVSPAGGTPPYSYDWSTAGLEGNNPSGLSAGNYEVTITDDVGSTFVLNIEVEDPPAIVINLNATPETQGMLDGTVSAFATGGTSPLFYSWNTNPPSNQQIIFDLPAGTYTVTVTDANGCMLTDSVVVELLTNTIERESAGALEVFPNPFEEVIYLKAKGQAVHSVEVINLHNAHGQVIWSGGFQTEIKFKDLNPGTYWLEIIYDTDRQLVPIVRQ